MNLALIIKTSRNTLIQRLVYPICYKNILLFTCRYFKYIICYLLWSNTWISMGIITLLIYKDAVKVLTSTSLGILLKPHTVKTDIGGLSPAPTPWPRRSAWCPRQCGVQGNVNVTSSVPGLCPCCLPPEPTGDTVKMASGHESKKQLSRQVTCEYT